jgi:pyruvate/2-oxoglutarate dehydrogenase complex dihydrolipoamide dehydrogenase (E3) component
MRFVILGGGPAGYAAAAAAAAIGADVTLVEDVGLGGNATLWDAIPSKTLLSTAGVRATVVRAEALGLAFQHGTPQVDLLRTVAHARYVAAHQSRSIRDRLEGTSTHLVSGHARIAAPGLLNVTGATGEREVPYDRLVLATGAAPWEPPFAQVDHQRVFTPRDVLTLRRLPEHLVVVGAGATGCEYAEFFLSCGVRVTLLSARPQVLPAEDRDIAEIVEEAFLARGCELQFDARVADVEHNDDGVAVTTADGRCFDGSHAIVCMGMRPASADLGLDVLGIATDDRGAVLVDGNGLTSAAGVYAVGDLAGGMMLASTASMQGRHAALHALGASTASLDLTTVPWTIFTRPEVASVGLTAGEADRRGADVAITKHYLGANPRGVISGNNEGMIKLVSSAADGVLYGASIVGYRASEMIATLALAVRAQLPVETIADTGTVTPSMSESLQRAAEKAATARLTRTPDAALASSQP